MGDCKDCMTWEEEMYWNHFQSIHFSQFLHAGFEHHLVIPEIFSKNCRKKLPGTVTLKSPSGTNYTVEIAAQNENLAFNRGWEEFAKDHLLQHNDLLIFKFNGVSHFDVLMFDGQSLCEKGSSYFVRKREHEGHENQCRENRRFPDCSGISSSYEMEETTRKPPDETVDIALQEPPSNPSANKKLNPGIYPVNAFRTMPRTGRGDGLSNLGAETDIKPDIREMSSGTKMACSNLKYLKHGRVPTEMEKRNAVFRAQAAKTDKGFMVVMRRSHVISKYLLVIPVKWIFQHMSMERRTVILRMDGRSWHTAFNYSRTRNCGGISSGWRKFVVDNRLNLFDVCVFEPPPASHPTAGKPFHLDVSIFRAVQVDSAFTGNQDPVSYVEAISP